jgi:hypothetical protein
MNAHIKAILKKLEGHRDEMLADLDVYLMHPVGVGEHSNIGEEIEGKLAKIDELEGKITVIKNHFSQEAL